jgi:hypothetical protein
VRTKRSAIAFAFGDRIASGYVEDDSFVLSSFAEGSLSMSIPFIVIEL